MSRPLLIAALALGLAACGAPAAPSPTPDPIAVAPTPAPTVAPTPTPVPGICSFGVITGEFREEVALLIATSPDAGEVVAGDPTRVLEYDEVPGGLTDPSYLAENERAIIAALESGGAAAGSAIGPGSLLPGYPDGWDNQPRPSLSSGSYAFGFAREVVASLTIADCPDLRDLTVVPAETLGARMRSTGIAYLVRTCAEGPLEPAAAEALFSGRSLNENSRFLIGDFHKQSCPD